MLKKIAAILSAVMFAILALVPAMPACADSTMYVAASNGRYVNVRELPTKDSGSKVLLGVGFPVTVKEYDSEWSQVSVKVNGKTINGYINSQYLSGRDPSTRTQKFRDVSKTFTVTVRPSSANGRVNLWAQPSRRGAEVRTLNKGESLTVLSESNAWYLAEDANGTLGYVAKAYVKK